MRIEDLFSIVMILVSVSQPVSKAL